MYSLTRFRLRDAVLAVAAVVVLSTQLYAQPQTSTAQFRVTQPQFNLSVSPANRIPIEQPSFGDGITGTLDANGLLVINGSGQAVAGLEFLSEAGLLTPIPGVDGGPASAAPFQLLLSNTPNQVTLGNLGNDNSLTIDGSLTLAVGYRGDLPSNDLTAQWGRGVEAIEFPVTSQGGSFFTPWNLLQDGSAVAYSEGIFSATIEAGSLTGTPPDSPADRVDPNDATAQFKGVGSLEVVHPTLGTFVCTGTVIDDTHVLTAGHCFDYDNDGAPDPGITTNSKFYLNDGGSPSSTIDTASVDIHPDFGGFTSAGANDDLAVVTLASAVPVGTTKYAIRNTGMSSGEVLEMIGYGISGHGDVGGFEVLPDFNVKRSGKNLAELFVVDDEGSGADEIFMYDFDGPTGDGLLGGGTLGNDIETVVRGGDSGGPAFVDEGGSLVIAGVNTFEFVLVPTTPPTGEFGVLGGGVLIDDPQWMWISSIATGAQILPEPSGMTILLPVIGLLGLTRRRRW